MEKKCTGECQQVKPIEKFGKSPNYRDGRTNKCMECLNKQAVRKANKKKKENEIYRII